MQAYPEVPVVKTSLYELGEGHSSAHSRRQTGLYISGGLAQEKPREEKCFVTWHMIRMKRRENATQKVRFELQPNPRRCSVFWGLQSSIQPLASNSQPLTRVLYKMVTQASPVPCTLPLGLHIFCIAAGFTMYHSTPLINTPLTALFISSSWGELQLLSLLYLPHSKDLGPIG